MDKKDPDLEKSSKAAEQISEKEKTKAVFTRAFIFIFVATLGVYFGQTMVQMNFGNYLRTTWSASVEVMGYVASMYSATSLIMRFVSGPAMDSFPKRTVLMVGCAVWAIAGVIYSFAPSLEIVIVGRFIQGIGSACTTVACLSIAASLAPPSRVTTSLGTLHMTQAVSSMFATPAGLWISQFSGFGYTATHLTGTCIFVIAFILALLIKEPPVKGGRPKFKITPGRIVAFSAWPAMLMIIIYQACGGIEATYLISYASEYGAAEVAVGIGIYSTIEMGICFFIRPVYGRLTDKYGSLMVIIPSLLCIVACSLTVSFAHELWQFYVAAIFNGFGYYPCKTMLQASCIKCAGGDEKRGVGTSSAFLCLDAGNMIGNPLFGTLAGIVSFTDMWRFAAGGIVICIIVGIILRKKFTAVDAELRNDSRLGAAELDRDKTQDMKRAAG